MKQFLMLALIAMTAIQGFAQASAKIEPAAARVLLAKDSTVVLLDVRTAEEFAAGHIKGAKLLPYDAIDAKTAAALIKDKKQTVIVYCRSGRRSASAATTLGRLGYTRVLDLGGTLQWPYGLVVGNK